MASDAVNMVASFDWDVVTYVPYGGTQKTFKALVDRRPSGTAGSAGGSYPVNQLVVTFPMDATDGMLAVQPRKDRILFKRNLGDSENTECVVQKILPESDAGFAGIGGMWKVEVQV